MQSRNRIVDDAARVTGGALGALSGIRREIEGLVRHQLDRLLSNMDLVTRDEFDAVREMAATARREQERLEKRVEALESRLAKQAKPKAARAPRKKAGD